MREPPQSAHAVFDVVAPAMPCTQPKAIAKAPAGGEDITGCEANALFERFVEERAAKVAPLPAAVRSAGPENCGASWAKVTPTRLLPGACGIGDRNTSAK